MKKPFSPNDRHIVGFGKTAKKKHGKPNKFNTGIKKACKGENPLQADFFILFLLVFAY